MSTFGHIRPPAVAGMFYPADPDALARQIDRLLAEVEPVVTPPPKMLIAPHAGYVYSGATAARAYALLEPVRHVIRRVILLGPTHRVAVDGLAVPESDGFATPLGIVPVDLSARDLIATLPGVVASDRVHAQEHSLEVHLPFLQRMLARFSLLPIAVGNAAPELVAKVIDTLWGGPETLIVISSDLSHFHTYETAQTLDWTTCEQILALDPDLHPNNACGAYPVNGALLVARRRMLQPELLQCCNSGDTAGDRQRVVGYASIAFRNPADHD